MKLLFVSLGLYTARFTLHLQYKQESPAQGSDGSYNLKPHVIKLLELAGFSYVSVTAQFMPNFLA